jgi:hypothetical protein
MKKRTNTILLVGVIAALLVVTGLVFLARSFLADVFEKTESIQLSGERIERTYDVDGFSQVSASGGWTLTVSQGSAHGLRIAGDSVLVEGASIEVEGETLVLRAEGIAAPFNGGLEAEIQLPRIEAIRATGGSDILLRDVTAEELSLTNEGASNIRSDGGRVRHLEVQSEGAANFDLSSARIYSANIVLEGAGNVELTMTGGELTGRISGLGNVEYSGTVARESIRIDGLGSVEGPEAD